MNEVAPQRPNTSTEAALEAVEKMAMSSLISILLMGPDPVAELERTRLACLAGYTKDGPLTDAHRRQAAEHMDWMFASIRFVFDRVSHSS